MFKFRVYTYTAMKTRLSFYVPLLLLVFAVTSCNNDAITPSTETGLPSLTTVPAQVRAGNVVVLGGVVEDRGYSDLVMYGVCWGEQPNPVVDTVAVNYMGWTDNRLGEFSHSFPEEFVPHTLYYARAFAQNAQGIQYAAQVSFTTNN